MTKNNYLVVYASPKLKEQTLTVESDHASNVRRDARQMLRRKYGADYGYCTILSVMLKPVRLNS